MRDHHFETKEFTPKITQYKVELQTRNKEASVDAVHVEETAKGGIEGKQVDLEMLDSESEDDFWQVGDRQLNFETARVDDDKIAHQQVHFAKVDLAKVVDDKAHDVIRPLKVFAEGISPPVVHNTRLPPALQNMRPMIDLDRQDVDSDELFRRLVVVTAFSENHRLEVMGMIGTVQSRMPATRIIAYDLGIEPSNLHNVTQLCNVELRPFKFDRYPPHVANIMTYAWKIIIIKEALNEFGAIFWADASVRFLDSLRLLLPFAKEHHGYLSRIHSYLARATSPIYHNFYYTQQGMFDYFAINKTEYAQSDNAPHIAANRQLVVNSTTIQTRVIGPLYACAVEKTCISPPGSKRGNHQFDASALMLVFYKYLPGEFNRGNDHLNDMNKVMKMHRLSDDWQTAKVC
ncbi:uncharacterized protein LOC119734111 isoform X2 [Patiria miniata]|nr:uncharacterized protein LOC119734111 isoform X2 [Patiria miniata]